MKRMLKTLLLKRKNVIVDRKSNINIGVISSKSGKPSRLIDTTIKLKRIGCGCFLEHVYGYGEIEIGNYVSISGPGTILHSEINHISIGSFSSIAENVSIQEFNHRMERPTTNAVHYNIMNMPSREDMTSKGSIVIEEDVWIGSNVVILSGVKIGRGSVIAGGTVVTKNVAPYTVVGGNPAHVLKTRFEQDKIDLLESLKWWDWPEEKIAKNKAFFSCNLNEQNCEQIKALIVD